MHKNPAKFFDCILEELSINFNSEYSVNNLTLKIFKKELSKLSELEKVVPQQEYETDIINGLLFLNSEKLVVYNESQKTAYITGKGFVKIKTEGFKKEILNKKINVGLQRATWISSIVALLLSFCSFIYVTTNKSKNCDCTTTSSNSSHKPSTIQPVHEFHNKAKLKK